MPTTQKARFFTYYAITLACALALSGCRDKESAMRVTSVPQEKAIAIDSPLHAVCITPNTPGSKVPSHGTDAYGESYAIDFVVVDKDARSRRPYGKSVLAYAVKGLDLSEFYGWSETVYAPVGGKVIKVINDVVERNPVRILNDLRNTIEVTRAYESGAGSQESITGNCVMLDCGGSGVFALLAHLKRGSVLVREGQTVTGGQAIGQLL